MMKTRERVSTVFDPFSNTQAQHLALATAGLGQRQAVPPAREDYPAGGWGCRWLAEVEPWRLACICLTLICIALVVGGWILVTYHQHADLDALRDHGAGGANSAANSKQVYKFEMIDSPRRVGGGGDRPPSSPDRDRDRDRGRQDDGPEQEEPRGGRDHNHAERAHDPHLASVEYYEGRFKTARIVGTEINYPAAGVLPGTARGGDLVLLRITCTDSGGRLVTFPSLTGQAGGSLIVELSRDTSVMGLYLEITATEAPLESTLCTIFYGVAPPFG
jgi:hypothetical protein